MQTDDDRPDANLFLRAAGGACADEIGGRRSAHSILKGRAAGNARSAAGALPQQLERSGSCLVAAEGRLDAADAVIIEGVVSEGVSGYVAGIDPFADTVGAERIAIFLRRDGKLQEAVRRTNVSAYALFPVMAPIVVTGYGMNAKTGFFRPQIGDGARGGDWRAIKDEIRNRVGVAAV
jgi:hypothetical protein